MKGRQNKEMVKKGFMCNEVEGQKSDRERTANSDKKESTRMRKEKE
jgi:hypothetical protein